MYTSYLPIVRISAWPKAAAIGWWNEFVQEKTGHETLKTPLSTRGKENNLKVPHRWPEAWHKNPTCGSAEGHDGRVDFHTVSLK